MDVSVLQHMAHIKGLLLYLLLRNNWFWINGDKAVFYSWYCVLLVCTCMHVAVVFHSIWSISGILGVELGYWMFPLLSDADIGNADMCVCVCVFFSEMTG